MPVCVPLARELETATRHNPNFVLIQSGKLTFPGPSNHLFWGVLTASGAPEATPKVGARSARRLGVVSGDPGVAQTPKIYDCWVPVWIRYLSEAEVTDHPKKTSKEAGPH